MLRVRPSPSLLAAGMLLLSACGPAITPSAPAAPSAGPTTPPAAKPTSAPTAAPAQAAQPTAAAQAGQPKRGGILKVGLQADPTSLDPQKTSLTALFHVTEHIYSLLVRLRPDLTVEPDLAEKWEISPDGMAYTV